MYARPVLENGETPTFGVSGKLWRSSLVMYDRQTRSLWSQVQGRAIAGVLEGQALEKLAAQQTTWAEWRELHPDTLVMVKPPLDGSVYADYSKNPGRVGLFFAAPRDRRLPPKELVYGLKDGSLALAMPLTFLDERQVVNTILAERPIVVVSARGRRAVRAFERTVDEGLLTFEAADVDGGLKLRDVGTGSLWDPESGECEMGELVGQRLLPVAGTLAYWDFWSRHHDGVELVR